jgi:hypothetical protein
MPPRPRVRPRFTDRLLSSAGVSMLEEEMTSRSAVLRPWPTIIFDPSRNRTRSRARQDPRGRISDANGDHGVGRRTKCTSTTSSTIRSVVASQSTRVTALRTSAGGSDLATIAGSRGRSRSRSTPVSSNGFNRYSLRTVARGLQDAASRRTSRRAHPTDPAAEARSRRCAREAGGGDSILRTVTIRQLGTRWSPRSPRARWTRLCRFILNALHSELVIRSAHQNRCGASEGTLGVSDGKRRRIAGSLSGRIPLRYAADFVSQMRSCWRNAQPMRIMRAC